jgi:hypothetical protein
LELELEFKKSSMKESFVLIVRLKRGPCYIVWMEVHFQLIYGHGPSLTYLLNSSFNGFEKVLKYDKHSQ